MEKSPDAFRTISEVATWLGTPAHVLRFWESRFPQIKPVKRAGGRRYYRPEDMALIGGIKFLLHEQGLTIRGVQKILSEQGVRHVASLSAATPGTQADDPIEGTAAASEMTSPPPSALSGSPPETPPRASETAVPDTEAPRPGRAPPAPVETEPSSASPSGSGAADASPHPDAVSAGEQPPAPETAPADPAPAQPAPDNQPEFAFGNDAAADGSLSGQTTPNAPMYEDLSPQIAARLRAGARIAEADLDTVRGLVTRLSALRARVADARPVPPSTR